jgi:hypothetical protein
MMRRWRYGGAFGFIVALCAPVVAGERSLGEFLEKADSGHGTRVVVSGVVTAVTTRVSRAGDRYYALDLSDGARTVTVLAAGRPPCAVGASARVSGTVEITRASGRSAPLINAAEVSCPAPKSTAAPATKP